MPAIRDLLQDNLIIEEIEAVDKRGVLREFARLLKSMNRVDNEEELLRALLDRESLGSTGIGDGVAIPHGKLHAGSEMTRRLWQIKQGGRLPVPGLETGLSFFSARNARGPTGRSPESAGPDIPYP